MSMPAEDSLLVSLRRYRPKAGRDSLENFVTEAFCWLLRASPDMTTSLLEAVNERLPEDRRLSLPEEAVQWFTQHPLGGTRPDMVATWEGGFLVFEHKVWAALDDGQVITYRELAREHHPEATRRIVVITANAAQHSREADVCMCWHEIYKLLEQVREAAADELERARLQDFLALLAHEGLAPPAPISHQALRYYAVTRDLPGQLQKAFASLAKKPWLMPDGYACEFQSMRYGRVGLEFTRTEGKLNWAPGIFLGCVLDGGDHGISHRVADALKLQLILDFNRPVHRAYPQMASYRGLCEDLAAAASGSRWEFYNHLDDRIASHNAYHPLYLETPLLELLRGTLDTDEQQQRLFEAGSEALGIVFGSKNFAGLVRECDVAAP